MMTCYLASKFLATLSLNLTSFIATSNWNEKLTRESISSLTVGDRILEDALFLNTGVAIVVGIWSWESAM